VRISFSIDSIAWPWHRLGNGVTNFGQFAAECGDRLLDAVRTLQRFDLAGDLDSDALE